MTRAGAVLRAFRPVPAVVWAATVAFALLLALYSVIVPLYEAPDEPAHIDLVMHLATGADYPSYDEKRWSAGVLVGCAPYIATIMRCPGDRPPETIPPGHHRVYHDAEDAPSKRSAPTWQELGGAAEVGPANQQPQHPPLYYRLLGGTLRVARAVLPGEMSLAQEVALLRLLNVPLMAPLPLLAWWTARRVGARRRVASAAALLPFVVPQLAHIGSTVNNDNLLTAMAAVAVALVAGVANGDRRWRTAAALVVVCSIAALAKSSAVLLLPVVGAAYALAWWRAAGPDRRRERLALLGRLGAVAGGVALLSGWWYLRNRVVEGSFVPSIDSENLERATPPPGFSPDAGAWSEVFLAALPPRFWGWFGWFSVRATFRLTVGASVVTGLLVAIGLAVPRNPRGPDGRRRPGRLDLLLLLMPGVTLLLMVIVRGWRLYVTSGATPFLQGRYLFPGLVAAAVVVACGAERLLGRWVVGAVALWAAVMQRDAVTAILEGYWSSGGGSLAHRIRTAVAWSPWPGEAIGAGGLVAVVALGALVLAVVREVALDGRPPAPGLRGLVSARRDDPAGAPPPPTG